VYELATVNIGARSRSNCCRGKAINITYPECLQLCLVSMLSACAVFYCLLWPTCLYIFFHIISQTALFFGGEGEVPEHEMCVSIFSATCLSPPPPPNSKNNSTRYFQKCIGLDVQYPLFSAEFQLEFSSQTVEKYYSYQLSWNSMRTNGQAWRSYWSLFAILQTRLKHSLALTGICTPQSSEFQYSQFRVGPATLHPRSPYGPCAAQNAVIPGQVVAIKTESMLSVFRPRDLAPGRQRRATRNHFSLSAEITNDATFITPTRLNAFIPQTLMLESHFDLKRTWVRDSPQSQATDLTIRIPS
jgi:hypothetical protein